MARRPASLFLIMLLASLLPGCGNNDTPPDSGTGGSSSLTWTFVDGNERYAGINPGSGGDNPQLTEFNSKLYAAWTEGTHIRVAVYNSNDAAPAWASVDTGPDGINIDPGAMADSAHLAAFNGKLYAIWQEAGRIIVVVYNGDDVAPAWTAVGTYDDGIQIWPGINRAIDPGSAPTLAVLGPKLYSTWTGTTQVHVAVYNGDDASPSWKPIDGGGVDVPANVGNSLLIPFSAKLYLARHHNGGVAVTVFNGNEDAPQWTPVTGSFPAVQRYNPPPGLSPTNMSAAVLNGKLYLSWPEYVWIDHVSTGQWLTEMMVAVYNGNDSAPDWSFVTGDALHGINKDPLQTADPSPQLAVHGSQLVAVWTEHLPFVEYSQVRIAVYNGNDAAPAWRFIDHGAYGLNFDPANNAYHPRMIAFNAKLYVTWHEFSQGSHIRVAVGK